MRETTGATKAFLLKYYFKSRVNFCCALHYPGNHNIVVRSSVEEVYIS